MVFSPAHVTVATAGALTLVVSSITGIAYRLVPQTVRAKFEAEGLDIFKDGTTLEYPKKLIKDNSAELMSLIKELKDPKLLEKEEDTHKKNSGKDANAVILRNWCKRQMNASPYFMSRSYYNKLKKFCTIPAGSSSSSSSPRA